MRDGPFKRHPVKIRPNMPMNVDVFNKRGDPWVTERQRAADFPVKPTENPDIDQGYALGLMERDRRLGRVRKLTNVVTVPKAPDKLSIATKEKSLSRRLAEIAQQQRAKRIVR